MRVQRTEDPADGILEYAAHHLYKPMVQLHSNIFLIDPEDQEAVVDVAQGFAARMDQCDINVFAPPTRGPRLFYIDRFT